MIFGIYKLRVKKLADWLDITSIEAEMDKLKGEKYLIKEKNLN